MNQVEIALEEAYLGHTVEITYEVRVVDADRLD